MYLAATCLYVWKRNAITDSFVVKHHFCVLSTGVSVRADTDSLAVKYYFYLSALICTQTITDLICVMATSDTQIVGETPDILGSMLAFSIISGL